MWAAVSAPFRDDETSWCGGFVGYIAQNCGYKLPPKPWGARQWLQFGVPIKGPVPGCVVVFWRGKPKGWSGHVAVVDSINETRNHIICIGGNQGDEVSRAAFPRARVLGYRWPAGEPLPAAPVKVSNEKVKLSTNEA